MPKPRGAVIGCGFFSVNHLHGWAELKDRCDIVAVCDVDPAKAEATARRFGVPAQTTVAEARAAGLEPVVMDDPALALDIDRPEDYELLLASA